MLKTYNQHFIFARPAFPATERAENFLVLFHFFLRCELVKPNFLCVNLEEE